MSDLGLRAYQVALGEAPEPEPVRPVPEGISLPAVLHCTATSGTISTPFGHLAYGDEITVTQALVSREGAAAVSLLELLADPDRQRQVFGEVRLREGSWPTRHPRYLPGSRKWSEARDAAFATADHLAISDPEKSAVKQALARYGQRYGYRAAGVPAPYGSAAFDPEDAE